MLFNRLLSSDYCQVLASNALVRATTSYWPNTTLNMLKFPITKLDEKKFRMRNQRLQEDQILERNLRRSKFEKFKKSFSIEDAELFGIVNMTFKRKSVEPEILKSEFDTAYSFEDDKIVEGMNVQSEKDIKRQDVELARKIYVPKHDRYSFYFYDTPGVQLKEHILTYVFFVFEIF